jgi:spore germination cell wall hydrolase CwlJ-like protein
LTAASKRRGGRDDVDGGRFALAAQDTLALLPKRQPGAGRRGLKIAAVAGGSLALGAMACTAVLATAPAPPAPTRTAERVVLPLREAPDPTAAPAPAAAAPRAAAVKAAQVRKAGELECLTQAIYFEARGESASGQAAVAQVVMNRVRSPAFPDTVCGVVYQGARTHGCQFSFACDGWAEAPRETAAWRRAREIAARALVGVVAPQIGRATHFHAAGVSPDWGPGLLRVAQVGLHVFYRLGPVGPAQHASETAQLVRLNLPAKPDAPQAPLATASLAPPAQPAPDVKPAEPKAVAADSKGSDAVQQVAAIP